MKKLYLLPLLIFFELLILQGCSNPVSDSASLVDLQDSKETTSIDRNNYSTLEFYVWKMVPVGMTPAVSNATVDIYNGSKFICSVGVTHMTGKVSLSGLSLPPGNYKAIAYTWIGVYMDYYGSVIFSNTNSNSVVSIQVNHI